MSLINTITNGPGDGASTGISAAKRAHRLARMPAICVLFIGGFIAGVIHPALILLTTIASIVVYVWLFRKAYAARTAHLASMTPAERQGFLAREDEQARDRAKVRQARAQFANEQNARNRAVRGG